jgi:hypothetical protein
LLECQHTYHVKDDMRNLLDRHVSHADTKLRSGDSLGVLLLPLARPGAAASAAAVAAVVSDTEHIPSRTEASRDVTKKSYQYKRRACSAVSSALQE